LTSGLNSSYYSGKFNNASSLVTQVVRVPNYQNLNVTSGASITSSEWDGYTGGIIVFRVADSLFNDGSINSTAKGFRTGLFKDIDNDGYPGESYNGRPELMSNLNNLGGGGGVIRKLGMVEMEPEVGVMGLSEKMVATLLLKSWWRARCWRFYLWKCRFV
jgi:hypothetical protein